MKNVTNVGNCGKENPYLKLISSLVFLPLFDRFLFCLALYFLSIASTSPPQNNTIRYRVKVIHRIQSALFRSIIIFVTG